MDGTANRSDVDLGGELRSAIWRVYRRFRSHRTEGSLGDAALDVLGALEKDGPQSLTELSERARVAPGSMSQTVNRLTASGYAVRSRDEDDRRKVLFSVTPEGAELVRATRAPSHSWLDERLALLGPEDRAILLRACELLGEIAET